MTAPHPNSADACAYRPHTVWVGGPLVCEPEPRNFYPASDMQVLVDALREKPLTVDEMSVILGIKTKAYIRNLIARIRYYKHPVVSHRVRKYSGKSLYRIGERLQ